MIRSFFTRFFTKHERGIYSLFCVLWGMSLLFFFLIKDGSYNMPRFEAVAKIGATWEEVNKEYKLSRERCMSIDDSTLIRDCFIVTTGGSCNFIDDLPTNRMPKREDYTKKVREFFPNAKDMIIVDVFLTAGYILVFDNNDRIIARFHYAT